MPAKRKPALPQSLGGAGKRLWRSIVNDTAPGWELDARDLALLGEAAKIADTLDKLEKAVKRDGETTTIDSGRVLIHPSPARGRSPPTARG
jgi:hypothetical protein